ncbi:hypothetical protein [Wolbachia endosymbiont (group A) of Bibio marci]|uniref:hypothetical protein n=1 Tax=Wolbachia endosymbiont (group A) of Bibio marci TaxID=2953987 RepID=UPI00222FDA1C|nr:hypothetical protein [Wolbachia endosymbiont (group A) of Bibio marci]
MIFIVNYYQYKVRCNKAIPVSGHWDDRRRGYCRHKGTSVSYSDDTFFYLIWVMQEVYSRYLSIDSANT